MTLSPLSYLSLAVCAYTCEYCTLIVVFYISGFTLPSSKMKGSLIITGPVCSEDHRISLHAELKAQLQGYQLCQGTDCDYDYIIVDCIHPENIKRNIEPAKYSIQFDIPANT